MKISFNINYHTQWGESLYICGDLLQLGGGDPREALEMKLSAPDSWTIDLEFKGEPINFSYYFIVKAPGKEWRFEWGKPHRFIGGQGLKSVKIFDSWQDQPSDKPYYSSAFIDGILNRPDRNAMLNSLPGTVQFRVSAPMVNPDETLAIS